MIQNNILRKSTKSFTHNKICIKKEANDHTKIEFLTEKINQEPLTPAGTNPIPRKLKDLTVLVEAIPDGDSLQPLMGAPPSLKVFPPNVGARYSFSPSWERGFREINHDINCLSQQVIFRFKTGEIQFQKKLERCKESTSTFKTTRVNCIAGFTTR